MNNNDMEIAHILFALDFVPHFRFLGPFEVVNIRIYRKKVNFLY